MISSHTSTPIVEITTPSGATYHVRCNAHEIFVGSARNNDVVIAENGVIARLKINVGETIAVADPNPPNPRVEQTYTLNGAPLRIGHLALRLITTDHTARKRLPRPPGARDVAAYALRAGRASAYRDLKQGWYTTLRSLESVFIRGLVLLGLILFVILLFSRLMRQDEVSWETNAAIQLIPLITEITDTPVPSYTPEPIVTEPSRTPTPASTQTSTPTLIPTATETGTSTPTPYPNTTATALTPTADLAAFGMWIEPAAVAVGSKYWKVIEARWLLGDEVSGAQSIFVNVIQEDGQRDLAQTVIQLDVSGQPTDGCHTQDKVQSEYACDFPIFHQGPYVGVKMQGPLPSEAVRGVGRDNRGPARDIATSFVIKFQRATR